MRTSYRKYILLALIVSVLVTGYVSFAQESQDGQVAQEAQPADPNAPTAAPNSKKDLELKNANALMSEVTGFFSAFEYSSRGRRDPFAQPIEDVPMAPGLPHGPLLPLQKYELSQLRLMGILWDVRRPKALLQDPEGKTHIIGPNTKIGPRNGYVAVIREGEIVIVETVEQDGRLVSTSQVVKIAK